MLTCFEDAQGFLGLDRRAFTFAHRLMGHPALSLESLARVIPALPREQVFYSSGALEKSDDFDRAHLDKKNGLPLDETLERLRTGNSYVMVRSPETDPSFRDLFAQLMADVGALLRCRGVGGAPQGAMLYLFLASPNAVTPFHLDRYSTLLMQFRGRKQVAVFPMWDERVVPAAEQEAFMAQSGVRPAYRSEAEALGTVFDFAPGQAVHIPFMAGHHVKNGADDVSVSLSIIFNTRETAAQSKAMLLNHQLRKLGLAPSPVGLRAFRDGGKSLVYRSMSRVKRALRG